MATMNSFQRAQTASTQKQLQAMVQRGPDYRPANSGLSHHPSNTDFTSTQHARLVGTGKLPPRFLKRAREVKQEAQEEGEAVREKVRHCGDPSMLERPGTWNTNQVELQDATEANTKKQYIMCARLRTQDLTSAFLGCRLASFPSPMLPLHNRTVYPVPLYSGIL